MDYRAPKGMRDVLPTESYKWQYLEDLVRKVTKKYGFREARTPVLEHTELFLRGVGDTTDIVQKEMYTFQDKGNRSVTLKPEGTAGIVRMFVEHGISGDTQPTKIYYLNSPVFRYERPQAGRLREHHQFGVEFFGAPDPSADAECILLAMEVLKKVGLENLSVRLNSIGCSKCRKNYQIALREFLSANYNGLCETCKSRYETNPLRILDCKTPSCQELLLNAPIIQDYLCDECRDHFSAVKQYLDIAGVKYIVSPKLVRGLDYYTKTVFEVYSDRIGSQGAICGGGRYDELVEQLGGPICPGVGFGLGMERLLNLLEELDISIPEPVRYDVFLAVTDASQKNSAFQLVNQLRELGLAVEMDHVGRSLKSQLKYSDKINSCYTIVLGEKELTERTVICKHMSTGEAITVPLEAKKIFEAVCRR